MPYPAQGAADDSCEHCRLPLLLPSCEEIDAGDPRCSSGRDLGRHAGPRAAASPCLRLEGGMCGSRPWTRSGRHSTSPRRSSSTRIDPVMLNHPGRRDRCHWSSTTALFGCSDAVDRRVLRAAAGTIVGKRQSATQAVPDRRICPPRTPWSARHLRLPASRSRRARAPSWNPGSGMTSVTSAYTREVFRPNRRVLSRHRPTP